MSDLTWLLRKETHGNIQVARYNEGWEVDSEHETVTAAGIRLVELVRAEQQERGEEENVDEVLERLPLAAAHILWAWRTAGIADENDTAWFVLERLVADEEQRIGREVGRKRKLVTLPRYLLHEDEESGEVRIVYYNGLSMFEISLHEIVSLLNRWGGND